jgi:ACT domain-containing protein
MDDTEQLWSVTDTINGETITVVCCDKEAQQYKPAIVELFDAIKSTKTSEFMRPHLRGILIAIMSTEGYFSTYNDVLKSITEIIHGHVRYVVNEINENGVEVYDVYSLDLVVVDDDKTNVSLSSAIYITFVPGDEDDPKATYENIWWWDLSPILSVVRAIVTIWNNRDLQQSQTAIALSVNKGEKYADVAKKIIEHAFVPIPIVKKIELAPGVTLHVRYDN